MLRTLFSLLDVWNIFFWGYVSFLLIIVLGVWLTFQTKFFQLRHFFHLFRRFEQKKGVSLLRTFFLSHGGIGISNMVGVTTALQMGGPGALLWVWVTGFIGAIIKYCDIYLGFKYRTLPSKQGYKGGPMYVMRAAFRNRWTPLLVTFLLCFYATDIYQFSVLTDNLSTNWHLDRFLVIFLLLSLVLYVGWKGTPLIETCSIYTNFPLFSLYILLGVWVIGKDYTALPSVLLLVVKSAFTGHAAVGGFAGCGVMLAIQHGIARAVYSANIGSGFDSFVRNEAAPLPPHKHALLGILGVFVDNVICTISCLMVLLSGVWTLGGNVEGSQLMQLALSRYIPYTEYVVPSLFFITGCLSIMYYFVIGIACAHHLAPRLGKPLYILFGCLLFTICSFVSQTQTLLLMSTIGSIILIINLICIFKLRKEVAFDRHSFSAFRSPLPRFGLRLSTRLHAHPPPGRSPTSKPAYLKTQLSERQGISKNKQPIFADFSQNEDFLLHVKRRNR